MLGVFEPGKAMLCGAYWKASQRTPWDSPVDQPMGPYIKPWASKNRLTSGSASRG